MNQMIMKEVRKMEIICARRFSVILTNIAGMIQVILIFIPGHNKTG